MIWRKRVTMRHKASFCASDPDQFEPLPAKVIGLTINGEVVVTVKLRKGETVFAE